MCVSNQYTYKELSSGAYVSVMTLCFISSVYLSYIPKNFVHIYVKASDKHCLWY